MWKNELKMIYVTWLKNLKDGGVIGYNGIYGWGVGLWSFERWWVVFGIYWIWCVDRIFKYRFLVIFGKYMFKFEVGC